MIRSIRSHQSTLQNDLELFVETGDLELIQWTRGRLDLFLAALLIVGVGCGEANQNSCSIEPTDDVECFEVSCRGQAAQVLCAVDTTPFVTHDALEQEWLDKEQACIQAAKEAAKALLEKLQGCASQTLPDGCVEITCDVGEAQVICPGKDGEDGADGVDGMDGVDGEIVHGQVIFEKKDIPPSDMTVYETIDFTDGGESGLIQVVAFSTLNGEKSYQASWHLFVATPEEATLIKVEAVNDANVLLPILLRNSSSNFNPSPPGEHYVQIQGNGSDAAIDLLRVTWLPL